jgi:hypothetical protein
MTDCEKEQIKLRANYVNGIALIFMGLGGLGPVFLELRNLTVFSMGMAVVWLWAGGMASWELHRQAQKVLRKLDGTDE